MRASRQSWCWDSSARICHGPGSTWELTRTLSVRPSAAPTTSSGMINFTFPADSASVIFLFLLKRWVTDWMFLSCSETEASFLQKNISSDASRQSSLANSCHLAAQHTKCYSNPKCFKRQRTSNSQSEEPFAKARRESEEDRYYLACASSQGESSPIPLGDSPSLFTPPYSPASSSSPLREELSHELLMDVHGYTDQLLSSPEGSPSYYSYTDTGLTCHQSPSDSISVASEQTFEQAAFGALPARSPLSSSSPTYEFQACTSDARLVPDCLSVSDMCESPVDCALHQDDFSLLEQPQGGGLIQFHDVPHHVLPIHFGLLTPSQSPTSRESEYSEREQAEISILAQQISSLASNFDMCHTLNPFQNVSQPAATNTLSSASDWPCHPPLPSVPPLKSELLLDDCIFDSILTDIDRVARKSSPSGPGVVSYGYQQGLTCSSREPHPQEEEHPGFSMATPEDSLPAEQFTAMGPFSLQAFSLQASHDQNNGLHQLNHYMQGNIQQGHFH